MLPEGTRSHPGQPLQAPHGTARIALESGAPVLPVTIRCQPMMLDKGRPWHDVPSRPGNFRIDVSDPYRTDAWLRAAPPMTIAARRLMMPCHRDFGTPLHALTGAT